MVVAVAIVLVMQMAVHQVVHVIAVRHCFMAAVRSVRMCRIVAIAIVAIGAIRWVLRIDVELVFVNVTFVRVVQMAVVQVIGVAVVLNRCVAAVLAVLVRVVLVNDVLGIHGESFFVGLGKRRYAAVLGRMCQSVEDELQHMLVGERIKQVLALAATSDDVVGSQHTESL